jgi:hypothetical protein
MPQLSYAAWAEMVLRENDVSVVGPAVSIRGADATEYVHNPSGVTFKVAGTPGADNWRKVVRAVRRRPFRERLRHLRALRTGPRAQLATLLAHV